MASPKLPDYYSDMLVAYADLHDIGDIEYGMERNATSDNAEEHTNESLSASTSAQTAKRKSEIEREIQTQRQGRKKHQPDLASGLNSLGEMLANGLVEAAKVNSNRSTPDNEISGQMSQIMDLMKETKASIDKSIEVNDKMLQFLKSKFE
ncbi:hypothetical protein AC1031_021615 [Aphanomyces cochlioides]|nr:hypothetical protein AC1031_021615 [Aphanomyces cochlioides]